MGFLLFGNSKNKKYEEEIEKLRKEIKILEEDLKNAKEKIETLEKNPKIPANHVLMKRVQLDVLEKNIQESKEDFRKYKLFSSLFNFDVKSELFTYKLDIDLLFPKEKYADFLKIMEEQDIHYVDDIKELDVNRLASEVKLAQDVYDKFVDFGKNKIPFDIIHHIIKGSDIAKIYARQRKFISLMTTLGLKFMDDLKDFDFESLKDHGFKEKQIKEYESLRENYYNKARMVQG